MDNSQERIVISRGKIWFEGDLDSVVRRLVFGLEAIANLKNAATCKDPVADLVGEPGEDADGFRPIHPRMKAGLDYAAKMAQETLDVCRLGKKVD